MSSPTIMIAVVILACVVYFVYSAWNHNNKGIADLRSKYDRLYKQVTHGVITDEQLNPLKIENASNMSEETMDYQYDKSSVSGSETECTGSGSETDTETSDSEQEQAPAPKRIHPRYQKQPLHSKLEDIMREHQTHAPSQPVPAPVRLLPKDIVRVQEEGALEIPNIPMKPMHPMPIPVKTPSPLHHGGNIVPIPEQDLIDDLKRLKSENIVLLDDSMRPSTDHTEEEIIEFHDIDDMEEHAQGPTIMAQAIDQKIREDLERIDKENALLDNQSQAPVCPKPKSDKAKPKILAKPKTPKPIHLMRQRQQEMLHCQEQKLCP